MTERDPLEDFCAADVLGGLHGFQRDAVEYAFQRLFHEPEGSRRFLVADEVGLGKTLIAKGILAKTIEHLRERVDRIDIVYICSNLSIASQNIDRLNPIRGMEFSNAERITLLPVHLDELSDQRLNFISFTPGTSLNLGNSMGAARERILLYLLLERHWGLTGVSGLNVLQGGVRDYQRFRDRVRSFETNESISEELAQRFYAALDSKPDLRTEFESVCERFSRTRTEWPEEDQSNRRRIVGQLREELARACIEALQPDLIILDEFQRFRELLSADSEQGELANQLFSWTKGAERAHVLLLSATPYKALTLDHESAEDDHYADFLHTVRFLDADESRTDGLKKWLDDYRKELIGLRDSDGEKLRYLKTCIEHHLRRVMSRTERLSSDIRFNGMVRTATGGMAEVDSGDIRAYGALRQLSEEFEAGDGMEYWKSAAFPVNFMEGYELRRELDQQTRRQGVSKALGDALTAVGKHGVPVEKIMRYEELIPLPNARMRELVAELSGSGAFGPLWLPPSLPYYRVSGTFVQTRTLSKQLIFSAWNMVPRSLAALLSYECERIAFRGDEQEPVNSAEARKARRGLLRFSESDGRLSGMPILTLIYPSSALARQCDPREFHRASPGELPQPHEILGWAKDRVRELLPPDIEFAMEGQTSDERWYWASLILMDRDSGKGILDWWQEADTAKRWIDGDDPEQDDERESADLGWRRHFAEALQVAQDGRWPTGKAPHDLVDTLAIVGLAAPATSAYRALEALYSSGEGCKPSTIRTASASIGWGFRSLFNRPESTALVRRGRKSAPFWRLALDYCHEGCLASVLDEFLHVLRDARGQTSKHADEAIPNLASAVLLALQVRTASLDADRPRVDAEANRVTFDKHPMRSHFAMRFGSEKSEDQERVRRDSSVSAAFNSPFWPFVLATTSVGQEGLDFHWYCHTVVHWNLPSNPVDLEQREGRVHRFKGHAIRKNVAKIHGTAALASATRDIWTEIFDRARADAPAGDRGLVPYWLYPLDDGAWIERRIPLYPLSRDEARLRALQRSLGAYRMVFGQPRQDELMAYLIEHLDPARLDEWSKVLMMNLAPPRTCP